MRVGVIFPQTESGTDLKAIREYVQAVESMGYHHILLYDHVLGAHPDRIAHLPRRPYNDETLFHEILVFMGWLAAVTERVELATGVLVLPQRQTALVAKQAAEIDVLSGGRLRFGVGVGWNDAEYDSLGQDFNTRGKRMDEQIELLRLYWTQKLVDFQGQFDSSRQVGIKPLPVQQPIPIWFGGPAIPALRRAARLGDGWIHTELHKYGKPVDPAESVAQVRRFVEEAGRDPATFGIDGRIFIGKSTDEVKSRFALWQQIGASHISINTMGAGFASLKDHIKALEAAAKITLG